MICEKCVRNRPNTCKTRKIINSLNVKEDNCLLLTHGDRKATKKEKCVYDIYCIVRLWFFQINKMYLKKYYRNTIRGLVITKRHKQVLFKKLTKEIRTGCFWRYFDLSCMQDVYTYVRTHLNRTRV